MRLCSASQFCVSFVPQSIEGTPCQSSSPWSSAGGMVGAQDGGDELPGRLRMSVLPEPAGAAQLNWVTPRRASTKMARIGTKQPLARERLMWRENTLGILSTSATSDRGGGRRTGRLVLGGATSPAE